MEGRKGKAAWTRRQQEREELRQTLTVGNTLFDLKKKKVGYRPRIRLNVNAVDFKELICCKNPHLLMILSKLCQCSIIKN